MKLYYMDVRDIPDMAVCDESLEKYKCFLNVEERDNIRRRCHRMDKKRSFAAHFLLFYAWKSYASEEQMMPVRKRNMHGKPYFSGENMPAFNLSHSGEIAVCAFDDEKLQRLERVGVDVQEIREIGEGIIERFYSEAEYQEAIQSEKRIASEIWSKKESLGKCRGYGLHGNLKELDTTVCKELFYVYMLSGNKETVIEEQGALGRLQGEYVLTVCTDSPCQVEMYQVSWRE